MVPWSAQRLRDEGPRTTDGRRTRHLGRRTGCYTKTKTALTPGPVTGGWETSTRLSERSNRRSPSREAATVSSASHVLETAVAWAAMSGRFELGAEILGSANRIREQTGDKPRPWERVIPGDLAAEDRRLARARRVRRRSSTRRPEGLHPRAAFRSAGAARGVRRERRLKNGDDQEIESIAVLASRSAWALSARPTCSKVTLPISCASTRAVACSGCSPAFFTL